MKYVLFIFFLGILWGGCIVLALTRPEFSWVGLIALAAGLAMAVVLALAKETE